MNEKATDWGVARGLGEVTEQQWSTLMETEPIEEGGLMRCCLSSWAQQRLSAPEKPVHGQQIKCQYCNNPIVWNDGAGSWRWDSDSHPRQFGRCASCGGNDMDAPCAYPGEGKPHCLRDQRLERWLAGAE